MKTLDEKSKEKRIKSIESKHFYNIFRFLILPNTQVEIHDLKYYEVIPPVLLYKFRPTNKCFNTRSAPKRDINSQSLVRYKKQAPSLNHKSIIYY